MFYIYILIFVNPILQTMVTFELTGPTTSLRKIIRRSNRQLHNSKKKVASLLIEWGCKNEEGEYLQSWEPERLMYEQVPEMVRLFYDHKGFKDRFRRRFYNNISKPRAFLRQESGEDMFLVRIKSFKGQSRKQEWISRRRLNINNPSILYLIPF